MPITADEYMSHFKRVADSSKSHDSIKKYEIAVMAMAAYEDVEKMKSCRTCKYLGFETCLEGGNSEANSRFVTCGIYKNNWKWRGEK